MKMLTLLVAGAVLATPALAQSPAKLAAQVASLRHQVEALRARSAKHEWPDLSRSEKAALAAVLKTIPKGVKFDIECNTASCDVLAEDIDDALEAAGFESVLDRSLGPLGYGIAIQVNEADRAAAEAAIAALKKATGGRLDLPLMIAQPNANPPGYVTVVIGKYRPQ